MLPAGLVIKKKVTWLQDFQVNYLSDGKWIEDMSLFTSVQDLSDTDLEITV